MDVLERFVASYTGTALWSSTDGNGTPLDRMDTVLGECDLYVGDDGKIYAA